MTVTLPAMFESFVRQKIDSGAYQTADEVVADSLSLLRQEERWKTSASTKIEEGLDDLKAGRALTAAESEAQMADFKARWHAGR